MSHGFQVYPWRARVGGLLVWVATLVLMLFTEPSLSIVWDEGYTLGRENRIRLWFQALADPSAFASRWQPPRIELVEDRRAPPEAHEIDTRAKLFDSAVLSWFWPYGREEPHGHPPFYAIVGMLGDLLAPSWEVLPRARLGPMLVFSLTAGALFAFCARRLGSWPAALAAGAWVLQPRLFAHGHYATYDALLSSLWLGSILAFWCALEPVAQPRRNPRWGWVVLFGLLAGWAADTKLTGWAMPLPFLVWTAIYRDRRGLLTLLVGGVVAAVVLYAFNPPWWPAPIAGIERFLHSNLSRDRTIRIPVLFLGEVIETPNGSLPWYNTLVWTVFATPFGLLLLALTGVVRALRHARSRAFELLPLFHWAFLLALRALPHTPGHDGERQFLPAFGCLALVAGLGASAVMERWPRWGRAVLAAALAEAALGVALMMPVPLSYYSPQVGGLAGASALGMEPTYYWDAFSPEALDWLNAHTPPGDKVRFATNPSSWLYLRQTGRLRPGFLPGPGRWAWYVLQNRPGAFSATDRALIAHGKAAFVVSKWGVPLVWIFPFAQLEAVSGATLRSEGLRP